MPEERIVDCGRVRLNVASEGSGPPVLLLHGFPEFWYSWRRQIPALAAAGYRVIAPDLAGYNLSDKPKGVRAYHVRPLVEDLLGLLRALGLPRVHLVAHDWGGVLGWYLAANHPEVVDRHVEINAPHPRIMRRELFTNPSQLRRSWYIFYNQLPWLPERMFAHPAFFRKVLRGTSTRREAFSDADIARYEEAFRRPYARTATINYYRAAIRYPQPRIRQVDRPTLVIWGEQDRFLGPGMLVGLEREVRDLRVLRIPEGSHWVHHEFPDQVNEAILGFLKDS